MPIERLGKGVAAALHGKTHMDIVP